MRKEKRARRTVRRVLIEHVGCARLNLGLEDRVPKLLSRQGLARAAFFLVFLVQRLELLAVHLVQPGCLVRAEQRPVPVRLDALHAANNSTPYPCIQPTAYSQKIGDPERQEQIARAHLLLAVVLAQVDELEDIGVPRLEVDRKRPGALVPALVDVARGGVVDTEHGHDSVGVAVRASDV